MPAEGLARRVCGVGGVPPPASAIQKQGGSIKARSARTTGNPEAPLRPEPFPFLSTVNGIAASRRKGFDSPAPAVHFAASTDANSTLDPPCRFRAARLGRRRRLLRADV